MRLFSIFLLLFFSTVLCAQNTQGRFHGVNTGYDEKNPVLSPDGQTLYFTIGNHPQNIDGKRDPGDIWFSRKNGSQWSVPVHGGPLLNDKGYNAVAGISADGSQLFLNGHYGPRGSVAKTQGIAVSQKNGAGWSRPQNIQIPYFMNKSGILCGSISADHSIFVFSGESYGTFGVDDIYVSINEDGKWTEPKNLGSTINTQFQELSPSLSADKKVLYFSSNGRKGSGSFDVYSATRLDDTWTNWSMPKNLGPDINSEGRELFFRFYPSTGFALYTTTKSSDGYGDVQAYVPREPFPGDDSVIYASLETNAVDKQPSPLKENLVAQASSREVVPEGNAEAIKTVTVYGKISNAKTGATIPATISFEDPGMKPYTIVAGEGGFTLQIPPAEYTVRIQLDGYISTLEKLDMDEFEMQNLEMNFKLQPIEVGTTVNLKNVLFARAKTDILPESFPELDLVVSFLKANPNVRIELMGHTDGRGVHADNVRLSQERVDKVKHYLVSKGIERRRISGKGFGGSRPIASNDTEESRRMNRRVEFVIKKF